MASATDGATGSSSPALSTSSNGSLPAGNAAMQAIKRHVLDFVNPREMMVSTRLGTSKYHFVVYSSLKKNLFPIFHHALKFNIIIFSCIIANKLFHCGVLLLQNYFFFSTIKFNLSNRD